MLTSLLLCGRHPDRESASSRVSKIAAEADLRLRSGAVIGWLDFIKIKMRAFVKPRLFKLCEIPDSRLQSSPKTLDSDKSRLCSSPLSLQSDTAT